MRVELTFAALHENVSGGHADAVLSLEAIHESQLQSVDTRKDPADVTWAFLLFL